MAKLSPIVEAIMSSIASSCSTPGCRTSSGRVNTPNIRTNSETQIVMLRNNVCMKGASAIFAVTAATTEVGGVSSPQTARKKEKKCTTHGSTPARIIGGAITRAVMIEVRAGGGGVQTRVAAKRG